MKPRFKLASICLLLAFLFGTTVGWSLGANGLNGWWVYGLDIVIGIAFLIIIIKIYYQDKRHQTAVNKTDIIKNNNSEKDNNTL